MEDKGRNVIVCSDLLPEPLAIYLPKRAGLYDLKICIEEKTNIPVGQQALYLGERLLSHNYYLDDYCYQDTLPSVSMERIRNGAAIYLTYTEETFTINVKRGDTEGNIKVHLPHTEAHQWSIATLRHLIMNKFDIPVDTPHLLVTRGKILKDTTGGGSEAKIKDYLDYIPVMTSNDCTLTLTILSKVELCRPSFTHPKASIMVPLDTSKEFLDRKMCHNHRHYQWEEEDTMGKSLCRHFLQFCWTIYIKQLNGTKTTINLSADNPKVKTDQPWAISVFILRELVNEKLSIPTYQQRLVFGDTVLNDWSECGTRLQLLSDYHIENGATISLVILTDGIRMKIPHFYNQDGQWPKEPSGVEPSQFNQKQLQPKKPLVDYINIPTPDKTTVKQLESIIHANLELIFANCNYFNGIKFYKKGCHGEFYPLTRYMNPTLGPRCHPDQLISSLKWLKNNYCLDIRF